MKTPAGFILLTHPVHCSIADSETMSVLSAAEMQLPRHSVSIDANHMTIEQAAGADWRTAAVAEQAQIRDRLLPEIRRHPGYRVQYFGVAPIPLVLQLGYLVGGLVATSAFARHHVRRDWKFEGRDGRPALGEVRVSGMPKERVMAAGDVVLRVSTSHMVHEADTREIVREPLAELDMQLDGLAEDAIVDPSDIDTIAAKFKEVLDGIKSVRPNCTIHLFASVQAGVAFALGTQIRPSLHPTVITYQFSQRSSPRYRRAVKLEIDSKPANIHPMEQKSVTSNGMNTTNELLTSGRIEPWTRLDSELCVRSVTTFGAGDQEWVLAMLEKYGVARIRSQGSPLSNHKLLSFEDWLGPARGIQNGVPGKIKQITPTEAHTATTGDSAKELGPHVDGTQDETTPAILVFGYETTPSFGGQSRFWDTSRILLEMPPEDRRRILRALSEPDAGVSDKKGLRYEGPLIRTVNSGRGLAIRYRGDDVLTVNPKYREEFELFRAAIETKTNSGLRYAPEEGEVVFFDNHRLLHGRGDLTGGRHLRFHSRMWIDRLSDDAAGKYQLGVRGIPVAELAEVEANNSKGEARRIA